jgi:2-oxoglutarate dehydrogenase complex dehydrogenase (E1) component-like enzyme
VEETVMGMAHRGRLNVLSHVLLKPYEIICSEFEETLLPQDSEVDGDVKYHLGSSHSHVTALGRQSICRSARTRAT